MKKIVCKKAVHIWLRLGIRKDGSSDLAKIIIQVGLGQKKIGRLVITTLKVRPSDWDQSKGQIKPSAKSYIPEYKTFNNLLFKELLRKNDLAEELNSTGKASQWPTTRIMDSLRESAPVEIVNEFYTFSKLLAIRVRTIKVLASSELSVC